MNRLTRCSNPTSDGSARRVESEQRGSSRPGRASNLAAGVAGVTIVAVLFSGCTASHTAHDPTASEVVASLGAVAIPSAADGPATPTAGVGNPQLVAIGAPLHVALAGGVDAIVTATGPDEATPYEGGTAVPTSTVGVITVSVKQNSGTLALTSTDFTSRDETGAEIPLQPVGVPSVTATPGAPTSLKISGTFDSGAAQVTWRHDGHVLAIWDFNIELD